MPNVLGNDDTMSQLATASNYGFSAISLDDLESSEYTLASIEVDLSGSVHGFKDALEKCVSTTVKSCKDSPREENLLLRVVGFNTQLNEIHGFRLLSEIDPAEYDGTFHPGGGTALFDAAQSAVEASDTYGQMLVDQEYSANAVIYIITDGADSGASVATAKSVKKAIEQARLDENLESIAVILIGVGYDSSWAKSYLDNFKTEADITQFVDMTKLFNESNPEKALAKLAGYVSKSISSTSQALSSGTSTAASSQLTF